MAIVGGADSDDSEDDFSVHSEGALAAAPLARRARAAPLTRGLPPAPRRRLGATGGPWRGPRVARGRVLFNPVLPDAHRRENNC